MKSGIRASLGMLVCGGLAWSCGAGGPDGKEHSRSALQALTATDVTPAVSANVDVTGAAANSIDAIWDNSLDSYAKLQGEKGQLIYRLSQPTIVTNYDLSSASDAATPERDPKSWTFEGSRNGIDWEVLDTRTNQLFTARKQTKSYSFANSSAYLWIRLNVNAINWTQGGGTMQIGELRVGGTLATGAVPGTPSFNQTAAKGRSLTLSWSATNAASFILRRYSDDGGWSAEIPVTGTSYTDSNLPPGMAFTYTVQGVNGPLRGFPATSFNTTPLAGGLKDLTGLFATPPAAQWEQAPWVATNVTDGYLTSKWYAGSTHPTSWLRQDAIAGTVVTRYTLTSANDFPLRDPKAWTLDGSNDLSGAWTRLDTRQEQYFSGRQQVRSFGCNPDARPFRYYLLTITANNGAPDLQLTEWRLFGTTSATLAPPSTPTGVTAIALSNDQIRITAASRTSRLNPETSYTVDRATDSAFTQNLVSRTVGPAPVDDTNSQFDYRAFNLSPGTTYYFRLKATNAAGSSSYSATVNAPTTSVSPPATWKEAWHGHTDELTLVYGSANLSVYRDPWVMTVPNAAAIAWLTPALEEAWAYVKANYSMYSGPYLAVVLNQAGTVGGHKYTFASVMPAYTSENSYRELLYSLSDDWSVADYGFAGFKFPSLMHELNHIVEGNNNEVRNSPSYAVWKDSHWGEIFMYDLYLHLATVPATHVTTALAEELKAQWWDARDDGDRWLQDWYYPLYQGTLGNTSANQKGVAFLAKYFQLLSQNLTVSANMYSRSINLGEYIHFCSGAAGVNLLNAATTAFHLYRRPEALAQLAQAQVDFPAVSALYLPNRPPVFAVDPIARTGAVGSALSGQTLAGTASDPDLNATIAYSLQSGPTWLTVATNGAVGGTPPAAGNFTAQVRVTDNGGLSNTATLNLTVTGGTCTPETDATFCSRLGANCGARTGPDNCGGTRSVASCGSCVAPESCGGGGTANVCGTSGAGIGPCAGLCTNPVVFTGQSYQSGSLGTNATCHETTANLSGVVCGNFDPGRTFSVNGATVTCSGSPITLPARRNVGYCFQASAGTPAWSYFSTF
jgi:hypothetical protein